MKYIKCNSVKITYYQYSLFYNSYYDVVRNYQRALKATNLSDCPEFWGGYQLDPYYFEFWEGHNARLNRRDAYIFVGQLSYS